MRTFRLIVATPFMVISLIAAQIGGWIVDDDKFFMEVANKWSMAWHNFTHRTL